MPKPKEKEEDKKPAADAPAPALENADADRAGTRPPPSRPELSRSELETLREKLRRKFH